MRQVSTCQVFLTNVLVRAQRFRTEEHIQVRSCLTEEKILHLSLQLSNVHMILQVIGRQFLKMLLIFELQLVLILTPKRKRDLRPGHIQLTVPSRSTIGQRITLH